MKPLRILYVGSADRGTCRSRFEALQGLGHQLKVVNLYSYLTSNSIGSRIQMKLLRGPAIRKFNKEILKATQREEFDWVWVDKGVAVHPGTLRVLQSMNKFMVHHLTDDFKNPRNDPCGRFVRGVPYYDVHLTIHKPHKEELKDLGARRWVQTYCGFDPTFCLPYGHPADKIAEYSTDVIFVGHYEEKSEEIIRHLTENGIRVTVWGPNWNKSPNRRYLKNIVMFRSLGFPEYAQAIASSKIALCLLSKWNRNQHTVRTFEIPAIGTFMLGERTEEHLMFYEEGEEAEFFECNEELLSKVSYYLFNDDAREQIARSGHRRAMTSGYTFFDRIRQDLINIVPLYNLKPGTRSAWRPESH